MIPKVVLYWNEPVRQVPTPLPTVAPTRVPTVHSLPPSLPELSRGALHVEVLRGSARSIAAFAPRLSPLLAGRVGSARKVTGFPPDLGPPEAGASGQKCAANAAASGSWGNRKLHEGLAAALAAACDREWRLDAKVPAPLRSAAWRDEACPVSTGGGTRRVRLVRGKGRGVSD